MKIQGPYAPAPNALMGQVHLPQGMMGRPGSQGGRETMMMMMPGGPGMGPGGPAGQGSNPRPKSNTHIVQPAPAPLTGQDSMGKGIFFVFVSWLALSSPAGFHSLSAMFWFVQWGLSVTHPDPSN